MTRRIIELRSRPAFVHDFYEAAPGTAAYESAVWLNRRVGSRDAAHFTRSYTLDGFFAEIRAAGISRATVIGRDTPAVSTSNDAIDELVAGRPDLIGIGSVDPQRQGTDAAVAEVVRAVTTLDLKGINLEPGFAEPPYSIDDPRLWPVYETCAGLSVPVCLTSGPTTPNLEHTDPVPVGRVARAFPSLPIICHHGFWPYVNEIIGIAFRYPNVFLVPDMYIFLPGSRPFVEAANGFMRDQLLFATSFPFRAMRQTIEDFLALGPNEDVLDGVLFANAARVLKLNP